MDPNYTAQDIVRCGLCHTPDLTKHCDLCDTHLCEVCVREHLSNKSEKHIVFPFSKRGTTFKCPDHFSEICELYCESCHRLLCTICVSSGEHRKHTKKDIMKSSLTGKISRKSRFLQGIKDFMFSKNQQTTSSIPVTIADEQTYTGEPRILKSFCTDNKTFRGVSCLNDDEIWTCGHDDSDIRLYNLQGGLMDLVQTISGNQPWDIAVTTNGNLVYTDLLRRSINEVVNGRVEPLIRLWGWIPYNLCSTPSGDLLVIMDSDDNKQTKVVRYSGTTEKQNTEVLQSIQWDDKNKALYSPSVYKSLCENRNLDICVTLCVAQEVVVVCAAGKLRFRYTGASPPCTRMPFDPVSITTDSQCNILITDQNNNRIHIIDQDGHFLRYIENCDLQDPWGLCVDTMDNVFVTEKYTSLLKKIQYINTLPSRYTTLYQR